MVDQEDKTEWGTVIISLNACPPTVSLGSTRNGIDLLANYKTSGVAIRSHDRCSPTAPWSTRKTDK